MGTLRQFAPLLLLAANVLAQSPQKFMGRTITVTAPGYEDAEQMFPKGPATVCVEGPPRQCYTAPEDRGGDPQAKQIQIDKTTAALFFSAVSGGVSQRVVHFALLRPGPRDELE